MNIFWWPDGFQEGRHRGILCVRGTKLVMWFVWLLPRWLVYWCSVRLLVAATTGKWGHQVVPELTALDALKRWEVK